MLAIPYFKTGFALLIGTAGVHFLARIFHLYFEFVWFDLLVHGLGGAWVGMMACAFLVFAPRAPRRETQVTVVSVALGAALLAGGIWEGIEFATDNIIALNPLRDTITDVLMDGAGGLAAAWYILTTDNRRENAVRQ